MDAQNRNAHEIVECKNGTRCKGMAREWKHTWRSPSRFFMMLINSLVSPTEKVVSAASDMVADVV